MSSALPALAAIAAALVPADVPTPLAAGDFLRAVWLADLHSDHVTSGAGRFIFVPDSRPDEVDGCVGVEAAGPPGVLRMVSFARG
jgi:hypothetical protein